MATDTLGTATFQLFVGELQSVFFEYEPRVQSDVFCHVLKMSPESAS